MSNTITVTGNLGHDAELFWSRMSRHSASDCWEWSGARQSGKWNYGRLTTGGRWTAAHVLAWELTNGPRPDGMFVRHSCDNPPCCNPAHLELGSPADNTRDMHERGRAGYTGMPGSLNPAAKITPETVASIRRDRDAGLSWAALGARYGISKGHARRVALGINWKAPA